ncbi:MAG: hypothetical protein OES20_08940 [Gammaproteobacteria bacterium]|nr:hypothetical protein [Gammaproteobacteria bacterium]MDH3857495.1 hypothetical protein [Gammaproteobacteria bacterium]
MQEYYEIKPSKSQLALLLVVHGLVAVAIIFFQQPGLLKLSALALVLLLAVHGSRSLVRQEIIKLRFDSRGASIELEQGGQPYFYRKNKVYQTRWFAILKLINEQKSRTLILIPDRFNSIQSYRSLRYRLCQREQSDAA